MNNEECVCCLSFPDAKTLLAVRVKKDSFEGEGGERTVSRKAFFSRRIERNYARYGRWALRVVRH